VILGDGYIYHNAKRDRKGKLRKNYYVGLEAKDIDFIETFNMALCTFLNRKQPYPIWRDRELFRVECNRKSLFMIAIHIKNKEFEKVREIIEKYPCEFLRGFFDSEGCVNVRYRNNGSGVYYKQIRITAGQKDRYVLDFIQSLLAKLGIKSKIFSNGKSGIWKLEINNEDSVKRFMKLIGFSIKRKQDKYIYGLKLPKRR